MRALVEFLEKPKQLSGRDVAATVRGAALMPTARTPVRVTCINIDQV